MKPAGVILWERTGHWASLLRRALGDPRPPFREVRSADEAKLALNRSPASVVAIEFRPQLAESILAQLWQIEQRFPHARSVVLAQSGQEDYAPVVFEAGARAWIASASQLAALSRFIRRHLELSPPLAADGAEGTADSAEASRIVTVFDELFSDLAESADDRAIRRAIDRLSSQLPRIRPRRFGRTS